MDQIITNPGFHYIAEQILQNPQNKSLTQCRLVSRNFRDFIDTNKSLNDRKRLLVVKLIEIQVVIIWSIVQYFVMVVINSVNVFQLTLNPSHASNFRIRIRIISYAKYALCQKVKRLYHYYRFSQN